MAIAYNIRPSEILVILFALASTAFWVWVLITCALEEPPGKPKVVWVVLIALTHWVGALAYLFWKSFQKRTRRERQE
ncbi:PLDc N-terminal domain-containing protein [Thermodesulfitimonas sp.]